MAVLAQAISAVPPGAIDLTLPTPCESERPAADQIVVCGRRDDELGPYRLPPLPPSEAEIPAAQLEIGKGVKIAGETQQGDVGGFPSNRVMIRLKIKF